MAASEEFKQALRAGKLAEAFVLAMSQAPELKITTWIATPESNSSQSQVSPSGNRLHTRINLVEGAIDNEIGEQFLANRYYQEVQKFHLQQVAQGHQTIQQNLETLQQIFRLLVILQKQLGNNYPEFGWLEAQTKPLPAENESIQAEETIQASGTPKSLKATKGEATAEIAEEDSSYEPTSTSEPAKSESEPTQAAPLPDDYLISLEDLEAEAETTEAEREEDWGEWLDDDEASDNGEKQRKNRSEG